MSRANPSQKKRRNKGKTPPGPNQAVIGWKEDEFNNLVREMGFRPEWGAQYPTTGSTAMDAPPGYLTLYTAFFREGNFRLPITKFTASVLRNYGLHISQINAIGLPRVTHFEYVCRANHVDPTFEMFNSLHDWKQKFFYIRRGVIPVDMHYRSVDEGIPKVDVLVGFAEQDWYKKITHKATTISQLEEMALVGAGMSLLWFPKNPLGVPIYVEYSLLNVLDPKAVGAMVEAIREDGKPTWLNQIRGHFLHPSDESFAKYANVGLGEDDEDDSIDPTREEVVVLSSGSSDRSSEHLTSRYARAGPAQAAVNKPVHEVVGDDEDVPAETTYRLETRKKMKAGASERREKGVEVKAADTSRAGEKPRGSDPEDRATLTEMMKKKALEDKKCKLDEQVAALLCAKKARLHKEAPPAPSESEIDMGIFSGDRGNLLEEIFDACAPTGKGFHSCMFCHLIFILFIECYGCFLEGVKSGKGPHRTNISKITPPASPPSRTIDLSPPRDESGKKKKEDEATVERMGEGGGDDGVDTEVESSETAPHQTIYTKRPPGGGGATSGVAHSSQFEHVHADSWDTHNLACDDLPHAPRWNLTQGSRMNDLGNCHDFFSLSLPPAERMFQKRRNRFELLDEHVRFGVNFFATSQEIVREWRLMGEETTDFEDKRKSFA
ncbi:hypothetical protein Hanom_Chr04g00373331 [Helianthus anomalus]